MIAVREQRVAVQGSPIPLVRRAAKSEHDPIRRLLRVGFGQYATDIAPPVWADYLADLLDLDRHAHDGQLLVGVVAGQIVGYAAFYPDASSQGLGWPPGWAGGRGLVVHPTHRGDGIAAALLAEMERRGRAARAPVFAFHTSAFMTGAVTLYERLGYGRAPEFDLDMNAHYGINTTAEWTALAYLRCLTAPT